MKLTKEHCPNVYEKVQALKGEAKEIMKNKGLGAAFKFIVDNILIKKYNFNSKRIFDYLKANPLTAKEKHSLVLSESEVYKALGVKQSDIADGDGYLREDVEVQFDDDKLAFEEQELLYHVADAMAKYGKENISDGEWDVHCYEGNVLAWNSSIYTPNF